MIDRRQLKSQIDGSTNDSPTTSHSSIIKTSRARHSVLRNDMTSVDMLFTTTVTRLSDTNHCIKHRIETVYVSGGKRLEAERAC